MSYDFIQRFGQGGGYPQKECDNISEMVCLENNLYSRNSCTLENTLIRQCISCANGQCQEPKNMEVTLSWESAADLAGDVAFGVLVVLALDVDVGAQALTGNARRAFNSEHVFGRCLLLQPIGNGLLGHADESTQRSLGAAGSVDGFGEGAAGVFVGHDTRITTLIVSSQQLDLSRCATNSFVSFGVMDTLSERLKFRRKQLGLSQSAVARAVSKRRKRQFSQQAYASLEADKSQTSAEIATIAEVLAVPLSWLRDGEGQRPEAPAPKEVESAVNADLGLQEPDGTILEVDVRAGAGGGGVPVEAYVTSPDGNSYHAEGIRDRWVIPPTIVREMLHATSAHIRVFEVIGDSMEPRLNEGDRVFIDVRYRVPSPEGIFALWDGLGVVVKRIQVVRGSDPMRLRIISANAQYEPYEATLDEVNIIGRFAGRFTVN